MDGPGKRLAQLAVQQHLRAAYGIKLKNRTGKRKASRSTVAGEGKVFGIPLQELPQVVCEYGNIPCFLVEACQYLEEHIQIEGLFRKSGSVVRLKTLKNKVDKGENCLSSALPCDVAGLLKQFFRELPEPILPYHLQEALIKAQKLDSEERNSATLLISCLVNEEIIETLRYFFQFLKKVSLRSAENKMDSCNLAVIFSPNLLQSSEIEKISVHTEKKLRLQAGVLQTLIDHAEEIGQIPKFILQKIPSILGIDDSASTPVLHDDQESEIETPSEHLRRRRQSIGVFSSMTPVMVTPNCKRKYPADSCQRLSSKKRRSVGHSMGPEMLPNTLFNISLTPGSAPFEDSPFVSLDTSQASLSTSATCEKSLSTVRSRRSKRIANKKVQRVESGKTGCFSPKISRKEVVRRSLRLKFILGRSNRQNTVVEHEGNHRAESIGHRLAGHQDKENGVGTMKTATLLSPSVGLKNISKSEENLQIPSHHTAANYRMSWIGPATTDSQETRISLMGCPETEISSSETASANRKPLVIPIEPMFANSECDSNKKKTSFFEDENNLTEHMLLRIKKAFSESGSNLHDLYEMEPSTSNVLKFKNPELKLNDFFKTTDKTVDVKEEPQFAKSVTKSNTIDQVNAINGLLFQNNKSDHPVHILNQSDELEEVDQLITSHVIQLNNVNNVQKEIVESNKQFICPKKKSKYCNSKKETSFSEGGDKNDQLFLETESYDKSKSSPSGKVADHIHWFNKLSLNESHSATRRKPVLRFQRTPVRQSVRRINSLLETHKQSVTCKQAGDGCTSLAKSVSYETALSSYAVTTDNSLTNSLPSKLTCKEKHDELALFPKSYPHLIYPSEQTIKETFNNNSKSVLEDLTNHEAPKTIVKTNTSLNASVGTPDKYVLRKTAGTKSRYRGSPKNPIPTTKLLPIVKPLDL
ncbi:rho GTPase-activating protein 11A isoform X2 [Pantherophis guttatus]|uniref:Rho GTPase-activating protein 11A isoform X2 n=1 Tax=Pantherophis guttatus TaxID=94885 RepID=A0A6P9BR74_PANGU|nr:rho GTPase-activating protein 11A isoform X2 [Pantherophis guttatus]